MGNVLDCSTAEPTQPEPTIQDGPPVDNEAPLLDDHVPMIDSKIWSFMKDYYKRNNASFNTNPETPTFISNSSYIANSYANVIMKFVIDWYNNPESDKSEPIYILEIGAGQGRLGYLTLKRLMSMKDYFPQGVKLPFVYVISDYTSESIVKMKSHPWYTEFIQAGVVDFSVVDCEDIQSIVLENTNKTLTPDTLKNPLFVVGNYVLSNLRNDVIRVENKNLLHGLLSVSCPEESVENTANLIPRLQFNWDFNEMKEEEVAKYDESLQKLISFYQQSIATGTILLPIAAIAMLKQLLVLSKNRLVFLSGDIGTHNASKITSSRNPMINIHGSFSMPTNYHALDTFITERSGSIYKSPYLEGFNNTCYVVGIDTRLLPTMRWMIHHEFSTFIPESFNITQKCLKEESSPSPSVAAVISVLRLARFDTDVFMRFKQVLIERGGYAGSSPSTRQDLLYDLSGVRSQYYPIKSTYDVCFELARIHMGIKEYDTAIALFKDSNQNCTDHHVTWHNIGMCYEYKEDFENARKCYMKSLEIRPSYRESKVRLSKLATEKTAEKTAS